MADFASTVYDNVIPTWINLDYVVRIDRGLDPKEPTTVRFINGETISMKRSEGDKLVAQLNLCCNPRTPAKSSQTQVRRQGRTRSVRKTAAG